ncbi:hypothetical protein SRABI76_00253 [Microbacterium oxydans]|uniref:hypothetical protein n=1 Tax=Microbacterium oxydans TaxID=82380 RepID=UPI001D43654C|nr:hypothetical protein [Microbacterium oxydans]CAH0129170.1 hypothetical protein SRABI76_00253 [Microbacterium oxydans]
MSEQQPDVRWAPIPPKPSNRGRIWLIVGLSVLALVIVGALLFFLLPRGGTPDPGASESASASPSPSASATASPSATAAPEPTGPVETPPPAADPSIEQFRGQVEVWLTSAPTGLDIVAETSGSEALGIMDTLQQDAQRLAESLAPSSISSEWYDSVSAYSKRLVELRAAVSQGSSTAAPIEAARSAVQELRRIAGL